MKTKGTFTIEEALSYELAVEYDYYWWDGDYETPPEEELQVTRVTLNGMDITTFFTAFLEDSIDEQLFEHARENKHN